MIAKYVFMASLAAICTLAVLPTQAAESGTVQVIIPWDGEGRVYRVAPTRIKFLGEIEGIMYIESSSGEMHEAFVSCPITQELDLENGTTTAEGECEITASSETVLFASLTCKGEVGNCRGDFKLTGGLGNFAGISGAGALQVRSPIRALAADLGSGAVLRIASGLAVINDLKYKIP
jgi:hypothetical protein